MAFIDTDELEVHEPLPGWHGRFLRSKSMTFAHYALDAGASIHEHHHPEEEVWHVVEGELEVTIDGETCVAGPGCVAVVPVNVEHSAVALSAARTIIANHPVRKHMPGR